MRFRRFVAAILFLASSLCARATVFSTVHGVVHDPQHRPVDGAEVTLHAAGSDFSLHAVTGANGAFELPQTPIGIYRLTISDKGFADLTETLRSLRVQIRFSISS